MGAYIHNSIHQYLILLNDKLIREQHQFHMPPTAINEYQRVPLGRKEV